MITRALRAAVASLLLLFCAACESTGYLTQAAWGQTRLLAARQSIDRLVAGSSTDPRLRDRLQRVQAVQAFAREDLAMHKSRGFSSFAAVGRDYAVWNVVAASEFSLQPTTWCFPVAGCVAYRGYFREQAARRYAARLERSGFETHVYGVVAYSTLGWFDDPVLDTWVMRDDAALAGLIIHEMAHQIVYLPGDTEFSESFARVVEAEGVRRWLQRSADSRAFALYQRRAQVDAEFQALLLAARDRLASLYLEPIDASTKRDRKSAIIAQLRHSYAQSSAEWPAQLRFDAWINGPLNNARLASVANYQRWVAALQQLLEQGGGELSHFYLDAAELAALPQERRTSRLLELSSAASIGTSASGGHSSHDR